jgi:hypothetical protein
MPEPNQWETFNQEVLQWGFRTRNLLKGSIASLSMKGKGELVRSLQMKTKKDSGEIDRIIFSFHRHGVFFHKGVGRGYIILSGRVIRGHRLESKHGSNTLENTARHGEGPILRRPKPWFTPVFEKEIPRLADIITRLKADAILDENTFNLRT